MAVRRSITELSNALTTDIDVASPLQIVRLLRAADYQIFGGYGGYAGLYDTDTIKRIANLAARTAEVLRSNGCVVLSGAGTSGRLAMFTARTFNQKLNTDLVTGPFRYTIAGGNAALFQAQEGAEDDPHQGIRDLEDAAAGADQVLYIGITCGLSAPYIAGQIDHILSGKLKGHPVLLGFNPVELARDTPIEGWPDTFLDAARKMEQAEREGRATVLNPVVGPEPITGSTRMKSGSATKILLEVMLEASTAVEPAADTTDPELLTALSYITYVLLREYEGAIRDAYLGINEVADLVKAGGDTLRAGGHIYYLGATGSELISSCATDCDHDHDDDPDHNQPMVLRSEGGILGLIDASECPPTYGAGFEDVRGFLHEGWSALLPGTGINMSDQGQHFRIGLDDFRDLKLPGLTGDDLVVAIGTFPDRDELLDASAAKGARTAAICVAGANSPKADVVIEIQPNLTSVVTEENEHGAPEMLNGPLQLTYKLILNALTTGGHVLAGKVYGNRMVDLRISNNKLFHRTVGIIGDLMGVDQETATAALLKSTYETDSLTPEQAGGQIRDHIERAKSVQKVVPKALLIATGKFTYAQASEALAADPIVRSAIGSYVTT